MKKPLISFIRNFTFLKKFLLGRMSDYYWRKIIYKLHTRTSSYNLTAKKKVLFSMFFSKTQNSARSRALACEGSAKRNGRLKHIMVHNI